MQHPAYAGLVDLGADQIRRGSADHRVATEGLDGGGGEDMFRVHHAPANHQSDQVVIGVVEQHVADGSELFAAVRGHDHFP